MTQESKTADQNELSKAISYVVYLGLGVAFLALLAYILNFSVALGLPLSDSQEDWGQFGDYIGGILNPFVALCALLLLSASVLLQRRTLDVTRQELTETRQELCKQALAAERQTFEGTFFQLLQTLRNLVDQQHLDSGEHGITSMQRMATFLRDYEAGALRSEIMTPLDAGPIFSRWYSKYHHLLAPYVELVTRTIEYVDRSERADKSFYADVLRATLSPGELFLLFHFGVWVDERTNLKFLAGKYGLFESFDPENYGLRGNRRLWYGVRSVPRIQGLTQ